MVNPRNNNSQNWTRAEDETNLRTNLPANEPRGIVTNNNTNMKIQPNNTENYRRETEERKRVEMVINEKQRIYHTTWPDTWPDDVKEDMKNAWLRNHKDMSWQTVYGLLMQDGEYPWYGMNTLMCQSPLDPETCADPEVFQNWVKLVSWSGAYVAWAMDPGVISAGVIKQSDIDYKFNRTLHCPLLQARLKLAAAEKLSSKASKNLVLAATKVGDTLGSILDAFKSGADSIKDNPGLSLGTLAALGAAAIVGITLVELNK